MKCGEKLGFRIFFDIREKQAEGNKGFWEEEQGLRAETRKVVRITNLDTNLR